jgi:PAS domain S-box-containing protein
MIDVKGLFTEGQLVGLVTDARGRILATSPGAESAVGSTLKDLVGLDLPDHGELPALGRLFGQGGTAESRMHVVVLLQAGPGRILALYAADYALRDPLRGDRGWSSVGQDRGGSPAQAHAAQATLSTVLDSFGAVSWSIDPSGTVVSWSKACEDYFGIPASEAEGTLAGSRLFASGEHLERALRAADASGSFTGEATLLAAGGAARPNQITLRRIKSPRDEPLGYTLVAVDVGERKRTEEFQRALFDEGTSAILVLEGESRRVVAANARAAALLGTTLDDLLGAPALSLVPDALPALDEGEARGEAAATGIDCRRGDGTRFPAHLSVRKVQLEGRDHLLTVIRDTSAEVGALEAAGERVRELERRLEALAAEGAQREAALREELAGRHELLREREGALAAAERRLEEEARARAAAEEKLRADRERSHRLQARLIALLRGGALEGTDLQTVLQGLTEAAAELLEARAAAVRLFSADRVLLQGLDEFDRESGAHSPGVTIPASSCPAFCRALSLAEVVAAEDAALDPRTVELVTSRTIPGGLAMLHAPIHRRGVVAGALSLERLGPTRPWEEDERLAALALADLASLALVRLDRERGELLKDVEHAATRILADSASPAEAGQRIIQAVCERLGWHAGALWAVDRPAGVLRCAGFWPAASFPEFRKNALRLELASGQGLAGRVWASSRPAWIPDVLKDENFPLAPFAAREGLHGALGVAVASGVQVHGVLTLYHREIREEEEDLLRVLAGVGGQVGHFADRRKAEDEIRRAAEEARGAYKELIRKQERIVRSEKLSSLSTLASGVAEEVGGPLESVHQALQRMEPALIEAGKKAEEAAGRKGRTIRTEIQSLLKLIRGAGRAAEEGRGVLKDFQNFVPDPRTAEPADLNGCLEEALAALRQKLARPGLRVVKDLKPLPQVRCTRSQIVQAFQHLLSNAAEAIEKRGAVTVRSQRDGDHVVVEVADTGRGMEPEVQKKIFEPFFTTKPGAKGLGLALAATIVHSHGGRITARSRPGQGSTFRVELPIQA